MKRIFIILMAFILLLSACQGKDDSLSDRQIKEIEKALGAEEIGEYYGTYNGYIVLMDAGMLAVISNREIGGRLFRWGSGSLILRAYKDGQVYDLEDVYQSGGIDDGDLDKILEKHKAHFALHHNWDHDEDQ